MSILCGDITFYIDLFLKESLFMPLTFKETYIYIIKYNTGWVLLLYKLNVSDSQVGSNYF